MKADNLKAEIVQLDDMNIDALRLHWRKRFKTAPPRCQSAETLRYEIAFRLQAAKYGDLDGATRRVLNAHIRASVKKDAPKAAEGLAVGARLLREWRGETHYVEVAAEGFIHLGVRYKSLSAIARAITGTHWSGARFFGTQAQ